MARILKRSNMIKRDKLELNINNAKAVVQLYDEITPKEVVEILDTVLNNCYEYVPEEELEVFRLPKGMTMR